MKVAFLGQLKKLRNKILIVGIAFSFQKHHNLPINKKDFKLDYVITVCNNANNEVCPIWPDKNQIIHWDIEDPVKKFNVDNDATNQKKVFNDTYQTIFKKIENWINNEI